MQIVVLTRWTSGRICEYAIVLPNGDYLTDEQGGVLRFHQKRAARYCLNLLRGH